MRKGIFLCLMLMIAWSAQAVTVKGSVHTEKGEVMPYVTISLLKGDSSLVTGTISNDDGSFRLEAPAEACLLRASYMGYQTQVIRLSDNELRIVLSEETAELSEVTVQGKQRLVERRMDKIVMNISSSPFAIGNNGKDILKKAPGVNIDRKGKVTVNGKAVEVYIDGRPSYLSGEQLKTMLEGTDGSTIDRLEIITQPSARYDAAGQGGIINIRTKRNMSKGINGSLSASYGGMYWREMKQYMQDDHLSLNLNYRGPKTYTSASLTQQFSNRSEIFESVFGTPEEERHSTYRSSTRHQYYLLKLSNDWYIDSANTIGAIISTPLSLTNGRGLPEHNYSTLYRGGVAVETSSEDQHSDIRWLQHTANLNYTHVFSHEKEQELTLNLDYNRNNNRSLTLNKSEYSADVPYATELRLNNNHQTDIGSARIDFETMFWKTGKIECGGKWLTTRTGYHSEMDSSASAFIYTEHIAALYLTMGKQFGEHWTTKLGLRGEYTRSAGKWQTADSTSKRSYFNLFPTAFVSYMPTEDWSLSLDYTRRIQRPHYSMLDPGKQVEDAHSFRIGNTGLKPAFTHNVLLSVAYSEYVSIDYDFAHTTDWIDYQTTVLAGGDRVAKATNYGTSTSHGIHLSLTEIPLVPKLSERNAEGHRSVTGAWLALTAQIGAMRDTYHSYDGMLDISHWTADIYAELNAYLPKDWTISLDGYYSTPGVWGVERTSSWKELNLALKKDFPQKGLTLTARVNDLMLSSRWSSESIGLPEGYTNSFDGNDCAHKLTLGLTYKFGTTLDHQARHTNDADSDRIESGNRRGKR